MKKGNREPEYRIELFRRLEEIKNKPVKKEEPAEIRIGDKVFKSAAERSEWIRARIKLLGKQGYINSIIKYTKHGKVKRIKKEKLSSKKSTGKKESTSKKGSSKKGSTKKGSTKKVTGKKTTGT